MADKEILCAYGVDFDAVAGWLGSYGGENSPLDISRGLFAGEVGVPRLLDLVRDFGIRTTGFVPGHSAETFPEQPAAIVAAGHEVGLHGYSHENPIAMSPEQEEDVLDRCIDLNEGRIAQTGSPREVYRNPANRFVAEFVGTNNILTGRISDLGPERIGIETDLGRFEARRPNDPSLDEGRPVTFVVSADLVQLSGVETALRNRIACSLISEEFVGSMVTLFLETAGGVEFKAQTSQRILERLDLSGATALFASWSPEHVHILPGDASAQRK